MTELEKQTGLSFKNPALLETALTHSSYINEYPGPDKSSNERLEFLGDAVLGLIIAGELYSANPGMNEGEMTRQRSLLVRRETLARAAGRIGLGDYLLLGRGEEANGGREKPANLEAALEALTGAVYLDRGLEAARAFVLEILSEEMTEPGGKLRSRDYKSRLQEFIQARGRKTPVYRVTDTAGPDHKRTFTAEVLLEGKVLGTGKGGSIKAAETAAAREALKQIQDAFTE